MSVVANKMYIHYDTDADVLTVFWSDQPIPSYVVEIGDWILLRKSLDGSEPVGVTVYDFLSRLESGELGALGLPIQIDWVDISKQVR